MANITSATASAILATAVTSGGFPHTVTNLVNDLSGNLIKIKGTITLPAVAPATNTTTVNVYWNINGKYIGSKSEYDLVLLASL